MKKIFVLHFCLLPMFVFAQWSLAFDTERRGIYSLYAKSAEEVLFGDSFGNIWQSRDSALTFRRKELQGLGFVAAIGFLNEEVGYVGSGCFFDIEGCSWNAVFKTENGGDTWKSIYESGRSGIHQKLQVTPSGDLWLISDTELPIRSVDNGNSFQQISLSVRKEDVLKDFQMVSDQVGYLSFTHSLDSARLYKTINAGEDWTIIHDDGSPQIRFYDFYFLDEKKGVADASGGNLAVTHDGGVTWNLQPFFDEHETIQSIDFSDENNGWLATQNTETLEGKIYRTKSGGLNWELDFALPETYFGEIFAVDENYAYIITDFKKIYRRVNSRTNTGTNANRLKIIPNPFLNFVEIDFSSLIAQGTVELFSVDGRFVLSQDYREGNARIETHSLASGVYFLKIFNESGKKIRVEKLVKQN